MDKKIKYSLLSLTLVTAICATSARAEKKVYNEETLLSAIAAANTGGTITKIIFEKNSEITLTTPVIYTGSQPINLIGNGSTIDGSSAGSFVLDTDLTAVTEDGTLIFNTSADIKIKNLSVSNSATRGIVVNIPDAAEGDDIKVSLNNVSITDSALYGLHIDDNSDEFDDGVSGSAIGIELIIKNSNFTGNGTGAIDFDGVRVDERAEGSINAFIIDTHIDGNGGDGIELDEAGTGDVDAIMRNVTINDNGFYNAEDLDDGFDIDEAGEGDIEVTLINVKANNNMDEGLDFDEEDEGDVEMKLRNVAALNNTDEGIKVDEKDAGDIESKLIKVTVNDSGDDGIQFTEIGEGSIETSLNNVTTNNNKEYGIKIEQWFVEDGDEPDEVAGYIKTKIVDINGNGKGDCIATKNVVIK